MTFGNIRFQKCVPSRGIGSIPGGRKPLDFISSVTAVRDVKKVFILVQCSSRSSNWAFSEVKIFNFL